VHAKPIKTFFGGVQNSFYNPLKCRPDADQKKIFTNDLLLASCHIFARDSEIFHIPIS
jgi:hypothetical protein